MCGVVGVPCLPPPYCPHPWSIAWHLGRNLSRRESIKQMLDGSRLGKKKAKKRSEIKSNYVLMNGKMSKWFTVHNRHSVPGNPSCPWPPCSCASAWPGATFLSRRACVRFLAELKMWSKTKAGKKRTPLPLYPSNKEGQRQRKNLNFIFALREF